MCNNLNADETLKALLISHLEESDCDVVISNNQLSGSLLIIFGDAYRRQWIRLPKLLFPSEERVELVRMIAKEVRKF